MKIVLIIVIITLKSFCCIGQIADDLPIWKLESEKVLLKNPIDSTQKETHMGYRLIVVNFNNNTISIQPDGIKLDMVVKVDKDKLLDSLITKLLCVDKKGEECEVLLLYKSGESTPSVLEILYPKFAIYYFISGQKK